MDENTRIFIDLWKQGASYKQIAQALDMKLGTVSSRAASLQAQGLIEARPRGGSFPKTRPQGNIITIVPDRIEPDEMRVILELRELYHELQARVSHLENPSATYHDIPQEPPKGDTHKWTIRLSGSLIEAIKQVARHSHMEPSHLVERAMREWIRLKARGSQDDDHANQS